MAKVYNKMDIEVKEKIYDIVVAKQNDSNSRYLDVTLLDNGQPMNLTGQEVRIYGRKADGKEFFNEGQITDGANGRCQFELTSQALAVANDLQVEISVWKDNTEILTTQTFVISVMKSLRSEGSVESSNEYGALVVLYQKLYDFMADVTADMKALRDRIGLPPDTGGTQTTGTVMAKLNEIMAGLGIGGEEFSRIKSIQKGYLEIEIIDGTTQLNTYFYRVLKIKSVNLEKSILLSDSGNMSSTSAGYIVRPLQFLSSTELKQINCRWNQRTSGNKNYFYEFPPTNWTVIEFA